MGHGRIEKRTCQVISDTSWLCQVEEWKGLQSLVKIESERYHKSNGQTQQEIRYYISSSSPADAAKNNAAIREHRAIENQLHRTPDVAFREDKRHKRAGYAVQKFSLINKIGFNVLTNEKSKKRRSMKVKRHRAGWDNDYVFQLLNTAKEL